MVKNNNGKNSGLPQPNKIIGTKTTPLSRRVESKVAEGDIKGAVKLLSSSDTLSKENESTFVQLLAKHPIRCNIYVCKRWLRGCNIIQSYTL